MNVARRYATATVLNKYICVAGGQNADADDIASVELYNPALDEWVQLADMNQVRVEFALFELNGLLYAMGYDDSIEKYDRWMNRWTEVYESRTTRSFTNESKTLFQK